MIPMSMNNNQNRDWSAEISEWWRATPIINKGIIMGSCILYLLNLFLHNSLFYLMADYPFKTLQSFQIWRIFTAFLIHDSIMSILFCLLSLVFESRRLENVLGSTAFLVDVLVKNIEIQIIYLLIMFLLHFASTEFILIPSAGLWDLVMVYITIRSASNPEQPTQFLCLPIIIKSKYYPFFIILLFSLISMMPFSLIAAMIVGYLETYFFNGIMIRLSRSKSVWIENKLLYCLKERTDFLSAINLDSPYYSDQGQNSFSNNFGNVAQNYNAAPPANNNYMGGRGVVIGGGINNPPPQRPPPPHPVHQSNEVPQLPKKPSSSTSTPFSGKGTLLGATTSGNDISLNRTNDSEILNKDENLTEMTAQNPLPQGKNAYVNLINENDEKKDETDEKKDKSSLI